MNDREKLLELVQRYADGIATTDELARLQVLLVDDVEARRTFRSYLELDAALERVAQGRGFGTPETEQKLIRQPGANARRLISAACASCALIAVLVLWWGRGNAVSWATVVEAGPGVSIVENGRSRPARAGDHLESGESINVSIDATARVQLAGLGSAVLGPSTRLQHSREARSLELVNGFAEISVDRPTDKRPWHVRTLQATATGVSSDFSIASAEGRTSLRVSEGRVQFASLIGGAVEDVGSGKRAIVEHDSPPVVSSCRSGTALLITSRKPVHADWDKFNQLVTERLLNARLWQMGFRVDVRHFEDVQRSDLADRAIVIVSLFDYGIGEPALERIDLAHADVPVICLEPAGYPQLGMSAGKEGISFGFRAGHSPVDFVAPDHPLAAGLHGARDGLIRSIIGWGRPLDRATTIAHLPDHPEHAVIFAFDARQMLDGFPAPARRVGLFLDPSGISEQSHDSWRLLEAAVNWSVEADDVAVKSKVGLL